jgi:hypothetical protein
LPLRGTLHPAYALALGPHGTVVLLDQGDTSWRVVVLPRERQRHPEDLTRAHPVSASIAMALGEDVARRTGTQGLTLKSTRWRSEPCTDGQLRALRAWGHRHPFPKTKGGAADLLTQTIATKVVFQRRLAARGDWTQPLPPETQPSLFG